MQKNLIFFIFVFSVSLVIILTVLVAIVYDQIMSNDLEQVSTFKTRNIVKKNKNLKNNKISSNNRHSYISNGDLYDIADDHPIGVNSIILNGDIDTKKIKENSTEFMALNSEYDKDNKRKKIEDNSTFKNNDFEDTMSNDIENNHTIEDMSLSEPNIIENKNKDVNFIARFTRPKSITQVNDFVNNEAIDIADHYPIEVQSIIKTIDLKSSPTQNFEFNNPISPTPTFKTINVEKEETRINPSIKVSYNTPNDFISTFQTENLSNFKEDSNNDLIKKKTRILNQIYEQKNNLMEGFISDCTSYDEDLIQKDNFEHNNDAIDFVNNAILDNSKIQNDSSSQLKYEYNKNLRIFNVPTLYKPFSSGSNSNITYLTSLFYDTENTILDKQQGDNNLYVSRNFIPNLARFNSNPDIIYTDKNDIGFYSSNFSNNFVSLYKDILPPDLDNYQNSNNSDDFMETKQQNNLAINKNKKRIISMKKLMRKRNKILKNIPKSKTNNPKTEITKLNKKPISDKENTIQQTRSDSEIHEKKKQSKLSKFIKSYVRKQKNKIQKGS